MSQPSLAVLGMPLVQPHGDRPRLRQWQAFAVALALEFLGIAAVVAWLAMHPAAPVHIVTPITIEAMVTSPAPAVPPETEKPKTVPLPSPQKAAPAVKPVQVSRPLVAHEPAPQEPAPVAAVEASHVVSAAVTAPTPPPALNASAGPSAEYIAKVKAAVQAAVIFPPAAQALNFRGRTRVEFKLRDGVSSQARILAGSGMGLVDRAALQSVQAAAYPPPPVALQGKEDSYQVWVEFN